MLFFCQCTEKLRRRMCSGYEKARQHGSGVTRVWQAGHPSAVPVTRGLKIKCAETDHISAQRLLLSFMLRHTIILKIRFDLAIWQLLMLLKLAHI